MAINPILAGEIQLASTTSIRLDRKVPDDIVDVLPPEAGPVQERPRDLSMTEMQAIVKMAQTNATLFKVSSEYDAVLRSRITPPPVRFDWEVGAPVPKQDKAVSLGLSADQPVQKQTTKIKETTNVRSKSDK
jgi:hypothetical protein